jgi:amidase
VSSDADLMRRPVAELAALVRGGQLSATELIDASLRRIDELQPVVNAFVDVEHDAARGAAAAIGPGDERPFAGVPIAVKNNRAVRGTRLTRCADLAGDVVARHDHSVVRRLRDAGFVIVGTTSLPEWGILPVTEPRRFGAACNPWDLGRTPGGSSGGSAAAVAAGTVPIAHGNDGGGSLRIPAACCGLVGLKPARGRVSLAPDAGESFLLQDGVLTRTVRETAELLDVLAGPEPGDAAWAQPPPEPFAQAASRDPGRLRIALATVSPLEAGLDPVCERAALDAAALLESLGHDVEQAQPPWRRPATIRRFTACFGPAFCVEIAAIGRGVTRRRAELGGQAVNPRIAAIGRGVTRSASASAVPAALVIDTSSSSASSRVAGVRDFMSISPARSARLTTGHGMPTSRRDRPALRKTRSTISRCDSVCGPASSKRSWPLADPSAPAGAVSRFMTHSATSSTQIGW